jgi:hypothetical protein
MADTRPCTRKYTATPQAIIARITWFPKATVAQFTLRDYLFIGPVIRLGNSPEIRIQIWLNLLVRSNIVFGVVSRQIFRNKVGRSRTGRHHDNSQKNQPESRYLHVVLHLGRLQSAIVLHLDL